MDKVKRLRELKKIKKVDLIPMMIESEQNGVMLCEFLIGMYELMKHGGYQAAFSVLRKSMPDFVDLKNG